MPMIPLYGSDRGSNERGQVMEFSFGIGMIAILVAIIITSGSVIALIFRRMVLRNEKHDRQLQQ